MSVQGWLVASRSLTVLCLLGPLACELAPKTEIRPTVGTARRAKEVAQARLAQEVRRPTTTAPAKPLYPDDSIPPPVEELAYQAPDPVLVREFIHRELARPDLGALERAEAQRLLKRLESIQRPKTVRLTLTEAIQKALVNSYAIQTQTYNPAMDATRIVEAEAQFDAVFFTNFNYNRQDQPTSSQLQGTQSDARTFEGGVRKLLSTGTQVQASYNLARTETNLSFQTLNPAYFNQFTVEFRQPFLRGFGLDYNRSQIELRRLDRALSIERLRRSIRETIFNVEQAYWRLQQARRNVAVTARLLTSLETIYDALEQRARVGYDVYAVQLNQTRSRIEGRQAEFIRLRNDLKNAESILMRLVNDPELNQSMDVEIIPADVPQIEPQILDQIGEVTTGLTNRSELREAKIAIEQAQIGIGVAKNQALPRLDMLFRYIIDGLGSNPDQSFSQLSENDFNEYVVGFEFEWPIGNRGPEAAVRRARLQQAQAIAAHRDQIEGVINEITTAIRDLYTAYDQIGPSLRAAQASQDQLAATKARQMARDPANLQVELDAESTLASARQQLIQVITDYNIALVNLERQKGTLLEYNSIVIRGTEEESYIQPYRPVLAP